MSFEEKIVVFLHKCPNWQQEAAIKILENGFLTESDIDELFQLCKKNIPVDTQQKKSFPRLQSSNPEIQLSNITSIGPIYGIDKLNPKKPLPLGNNNLIVVYGDNGAGKSGYVRILKKVTGKQNAHSLKSDVFKAPPEKREAKISYKVNDTEKSVIWDADGDPVSELTSTDIFDAETGRFYITKEKEMSYVPQEMEVFNELVAVCSKIKERLEQEQNKLQSKLPILPTKFSETKVGQKFKNLKSTDTKETLADILIFDSEKQKKLASLEERLKTDPQAISAAKQSQQKQLKLLFEALSGLIDFFNPDNCKNFLKLKKTALQNRTMANQSAQKELSASNLDGIGTEAWKALWEAARSFSKEAAYPTLIFPETPQCVLCQQPLEEASKQRLNQFESYIKGTLEKAAQDAEAVYNEAIKTFPKHISETELRTSIAACGLNEDDWFSLLWNLCKKADNTCQKIQAVDTYEDFQDQTDVFSWLSEQQSENTPIIEGLNNETTRFEDKKNYEFPWLANLEDNIKQLTSQIEQHQADIEEFNKQKIEYEKQELEANQWISQQSDSILTEIEHLKKVEEYKTWINTTNTHFISTTARELSTELITPPFINRFNQELEKLGAQKIKVELIQTRTAKAKPLHEIRLKGSKNSKIDASSILSEGEKRIVELASFLADVTNQAATTPFVFDDPISSLSQSYEEKVIDRLIELSQNRQVIVFTHRLSLLNSMCNKAQEVHTIQISQQPWGSGDPEDLSIANSSPKQALNKLKNESLPKARTQLSEAGTSTYSSDSGKSISANLREILEKIVEKTLLAGIVQRHQKPITTKGKIKDLAKISLKDCILIDTLMTKYSTHLHSQSDESPVNMPEPDEIEKDIQELIDWHTKFEKRAVPTLEILTHV